MTAPLPPEPPAASQGTVRLRIDVDFNEGLRRGVPFLLDLLDRVGGKATFYVVMGPDTLHRHSGRLKEKAFRRRVSALSPWKVLRHLGAAYLRSRFLGVDVARAHPDLLREMVRRGHEVGVHGFDHAEWADCCSSMTIEETRLHMDRAFSVFAELMGREARTWAAPNWRSNAPMFEYLEARRIAFSSDTRGASPFYPTTGSRRWNVVQLPITLPCLHELVQHGCERREIPAVLSRCLRPGFNLLCAHDYYEGILERELFVECLERLRAEGWELRSLGEDVPDPGGACDSIASVMVPGGARPVSCQRRFLQENYFGALSRAPDDAGDAGARSPDHEEALR